LVFNPERAREPYEYQEPQGLKADVRLDLPQA
jgi:hypothetical protein